jgi:hypothetical protein
MKLQEKEIIGGVLTHVLHSLNAFLNTHKVEDYEDVPQASAAFFAWLGTVDLERSISEEMTLRRLLWVHHECPPHARYGDDGEMQCSSCLIDFRRISIKRLEEKFFERNMKRIAAEVKS